MQISLDYGMKEEENLSENFFSLGLTEDYINFLCNEPGSFITEEGVILSSNSDKTYSTELLDFLNSEGERFENSLIRNIGQLLEKIVRGLKREEEIKFDGYIYYNVNSELVRAEGELTIKLNNFGGFYVSNKTNNFSMQFEQNLDWRMIKSFSGNSFDDVYIEGSKSKRDYNVKIGLKNSL